MSKELVKDLLNIDNYLDFHTTVVDWMKSHSPPVVPPDKSGCVSWFRQTSAEQTMYSTLLVGLITKYPEVQEHAKKLKALMEKYEDR